MNCRLLFAFTVLFSITLTASEDFNRQLPGKELTSQITKEKFPDMDAVIILKEQSYQIQTAEVGYREYELSGLSTGLSNVMIVKVLNEAGVKRYGTFEFTYNEQFGDALKNGFVIHARMQKDNGEVVTIQEDDITSIVVEKNSSGETVRRKVTFKYPDLQPGDIIQYEYQFSDLFSYSTSGLFYYSDRDFVLFSNLYLTLPAKIDIRTISLPIEQIGEPKKVQVSRSYGAGETYFWSVRNLPGMPNEPYSRPLEEVSLLTGFYAEGKHPEAADNWNHIASTLNEDVFDEGEVDTDDILSLGFQKVVPATTFGTTDSLYASLRKYFALTGSNSLYLDADHIHKLFTQKKADASDLSYVMYLILKQWGRTSNLVLIRDRREGSYDASIPTLKWFDRYGLLVTIDGKERLYDFSRSLPSAYEYPWYLNPTNAVVLDGEKCVHRSFSDPAASGSNTVREEHHMTIDERLEVNDRMTLAYAGSPAQDRREDLYASEPSEITKYFRDITEGKCLLKADSISVNDFLDEKELCAEITGRSKVVPEMIDSTLTVSFRNRVLNELREKLFTATRKTNIYFESPVSYQLSWELAVPAGYHAPGIDQPQRLTGPAECSTEITCVQKGDTMRFAATVNIPRLMIMTDQYRSFMNFLDRSIAQVERTITLNK